MMNTASIYTAPARERRRLLKTLIALEIGDCGGAGIYFIEDAVRDMARAFRVSRPPFRTRGETGPRPECTGTSETDVVGTSETEPYGVAEGETIGISTTEITGECRSRGRHWGWGPGSTAGRGPRRPGA